MFRKHPEDFRQHLACLLLAFCDPKTLPKDPSQPWPADQLSPAENLLARREKIPTIFSTLFPSTVERLLSTHDSRWTEEDVHAYEFLKAAFANPFKENRRLTGPLVLLWADQCRHEVSDDTPRDTFNNHSARNGMHWCSVDALPLLHDLIENHRTGDAGKHEPNKRLRIEVSAIRFERLTIGADVTLFECGTQFVERVLELQERPAASADLRRGSLTRTVDELINLCGRIEVLRPSSWQDSLRLLVRLTHKDT